MDGGGGGDLALQGGAVLQLDGHGNGRLGAVVIGGPAGGVEDIAGQMDGVQVVDTGLGAGSASALRGPAEILLMGGIEGEGVHIHAGGGVVIVHGLDQDAVARVQLGAGGDIGHHAAAGLMEDGGIAGVDHSVALQRQLIGGQAGVLVDHKAEGIGVDGGALALLRDIGPQHIAVGVHQLNGNARLGGGVGGIAAGQDVGIGAHSHIHAVEALVGLADGVGAVAGAVGIGIGRGAGGAVVRGEGAVRLEGVVGAGQGHLGVDHVELHVLAGVGGQDGPLGGAHIGVNHGGGGIGAHQVGGTGGAHDAENPGGRHHGGLIRGVPVALIQGSAVGMKGGVVDNDIRPVVGKQGQVGHTGDVYIGILNGEQTVSIGGDGRAQAGEVTGGGAVAIGVDGDVGVVDGVVGIPHNDRVKPLPGGFNVQAGGAGVGDLRPHVDGVGDQHRVAPRRVCRHDQAECHGQSKRQ